MISPATAAVAARASVAMTVILVTEVFMASPGFS
jgi:hypothetical protein